MSIKQISVFIENREGRLVAVTSRLAKAGVNILAISAADTADYGILRLIVDKPQLACRTLKDAEFTALETSVLAVAAKDAPGGMHEVFLVLEQANINIDYIYSFYGNTIAGALNILKVDDTEKAEAVLSQAGLRLLTEQDIYPD